MKSKSFFIILFFICVLVSGFLYAWQKPIFSEEINSMKKQKNEKKANQFVYQTLKTRVTSIYRGNNSIITATPGGSLAMETEMDNILTKADLVAGCVASKAGKLPEIVDKIRIKLYVNGVASSLSIGRWIINSQGTGNAQSQHYLWYKTFNANDKLSIRICNQTANRAIVISDFKLYVEKKPE
jgi:hypothetical protein